MDSSNNTVEKRVEHKTSRYFRLDELTGSTMGLNRKTKQIIQKNRFIHRLLLNRFVNILNKELSLITINHLNNIIAVAT